jgi:DNA processing protein
MDLRADQQRLRLALAARTPAMDAVKLQAVAAAGADLELLERPEASALAAAGLTTQAIAWLASPDGARIEGDLRWLEASGCTLLASTDPAYPELLRRSPDAPAVLYVRGNAQALLEPQIAMVGSRNPTAGGRATAREFATAFARLGLTITSGLALGIDSACHEGALAGGGMTVAVLGCGLDRVYPKENSALAERVAASGAVISEFPPGTAALREHFPQRNRIIAGLAHGTVVVEAARRSGSLITARLAGAAGREVFALPGSIHNPLARGCHELIRQGAKLVECVEDVLAELKISLAHQLLAASTPASPGTPAAGAVLDKEYKIL